MRRERRGERQGEAGREAHSVPGRKQQRKPGEGGPGRRRARGISSAAGATPRASGAAGQGAGGSRGGDKRRSPGSRGMRGLCAHPERLGLAPGGRAAGDGRAGGRGTQSCLLGSCRQRAEGQRKGRTGSTRPPRRGPQSGLNLPAGSRGLPLCTHDRRRRVRIVDAAKASLAWGSPARLSQGVTPVGPSEGRPRLFISGCPFCQTRSPEVRDPATWGTGPHKPSPHS